jgi:ADP-heptose:LPS heptosyltransferase
MKILILRFSSIGDIVLTTPVIRGIKLQLNAEVHYATKRQFESLVTSNPYVDHVHCLQDGVFQLLRVLRKENYDYVIDLHHNLRTRIIKTLLGVKAFSFNKLNIEKWLMVNFKVNRLPSKHIVDRYMDAVAVLGVEKDELGLDYFIPPQDEVSAESLPVTHRGGFAVYAIGGQHTTKKLPVERMIELCDKISRPIILLGGLEDQETGEEVSLFFRKQNERKSFVFNACGKYTLHQSASLVRMAQYVFTHDTGLMHIAAAFKKNIYCIWGNTIPAFGMYPYRTAFTNLENNRVSCRPCSKIGYDKCPKGHFKCMKEIVFEFKVPD